MYTIIEDSQEMLESIGNVNIVVQRTGSTYIPGSVRKYTIFLGNVLENKEGRLKSVLPQKKGWGSKKFRPSKRGGQTSFDHPNTKKKFALRANNQHISNVILLHAKAHF